MPFSFLILIWVVPFVFAQPQEEADTWKNLKYISQPLRDPFESPFEMMTVLPLEEKAKEEKPLGSSPSHLKVQGMVWGTDRPQVIINGKVLRVGGIIKGAKILAIRKEGVYVLYKGSQYVLRSTIGK